MNYRNLGSTGLKVSELGLGCSSIGNSIFNYSDENEFLGILNYAFENGINFFDTADTYAFGNSESLIGKAFANKRDKIIISTKVGFLPSSLSSHTKYLIPFLGSARKIIMPFKKSLKKLLLQKIILKFLKKEFLIQLTQIHTMLRLLLNYQKKKILLFGMMRKQ